MTIIRALFLALTVLSAAGGVDGVTPRFESVSMADEPAGEAIFCIYQVRGSWDARYRAVTSPIFSVAWCRPPPAWSA